VAPNNLGQTESGNLLPVIQLANAKMAAACAHSANEEEVRRMEHELQDGIGSLCRCLRF